MNKLSNTIVEAIGIEFKVNFRQIISPLNLNIESGNIYVISGTSGSGKTTLAKILSGNLQPTKGYVISQENIEKGFVSQQDDFSRITGLRTTYYSQRYESPNEEGIPTVESYLQNRIDKFKKSQLANLPFFTELKNLLQRKLLSLSNGERKRIQLIVEFFKSPDLMVLDQPFIGLDVSSREALASHLKKLKSIGKTLILVVDPEHIPELADVVIELRDGAMIRNITYTDFKQLKEPYTQKTNEEPVVFIDDLVRQKNRFQVIVRMKNVNVNLGGKQILNDINWEIKSGEKWVLKGKNGAGKTTLLSLISADNPQGYTNDLVLFDRKRGSGESIWDIKRKIGFVSPELHLYFMRQKSIFHPAAGTQMSYNSLTCFDVILSGLNDEVGFNSSRSERSLRLGKQWLQALRMEHLEKSPFLYSSLGEQRIILLARALIKFPDLLILDEPCQGLDHSQTKRFLKLLDFICDKGNTAMIYVSHRAEEIPSGVTHYLELDKGKVVQCGKL